MIEASNISLRIGKKALFEEVNIRGSLTPQPPESLERLIFCVNFSFVYCVNTLIMV